MFVSMKITPGPLTLPQEKREVEVRLKRMEKGVQRKNELLGVLHDVTFTGSIEKYPIENWQNIYQCVRI